MVLWQESWLVDRQKLIKQDGGCKAQTTKIHKCPFILLALWQRKGFAGKEWELKGLNMLVMFTEQIPCLHCHRIKDIKKIRKILLNCVQRRQHEDGTFDCDIWFRLLFEPPCDSLWTARCWLFPDLKATASKSERLLRITTGREYAARYALGWSLTTCLGSA